MTAVTIAMICGVVAVLYGAFTSRQLLAQPAGDARMQDIAAAIQEGAKALSRPAIHHHRHRRRGRRDHPVRHAGAVIDHRLRDRRGAVGGGGLRRHEHLGARQCAHRRGGTDQRSRAGSPPHFAPAPSPGMLVAGLGLLSISVFFWYLTGPGRPCAGRPGHHRGADRARVRRLAHLDLRAGSAAASSPRRPMSAPDLVGKVEAGIPEDDPRNPATIADNVGDNVGDCAGMAADLFETYVVTLGVTMISIALLIQTDVAELARLMSLPLIVGGGVHRHLASSAPSSSASAAADRSWARCTRGSSSPPGLSVPAIYAALTWVLGDMHRVIGDAVEPQRRTLPTSSPQCPSPGAAHALSASAACSCSGRMVIGLVVTGLLVWITEYYTGTNYRPVRSIAKASETGHGTNVIQGLAISLEATALALTLGHRYRGGRRLSGRRRHRHRLSPPPRCCRQAGHGRRARRLWPGHRQCRRHRRDGRGCPTTCATSTDALDAVGNTTKAVTKGYAIGSAALAALVLFGAYTSDLATYFPNLQRLISRSVIPYVIVGLLLGALLPYLFGAFGMTAVGRAAGACGRGSARPVPRQSGHHGRHQSGPITAAPSTW